MKVSAHPLVVAVALGLLGPVTLESSDDERAIAPVSASVASPHEQQRARQEWLEARDAHDAERR